MDSIKKENSGGLCWPISTTEDNQTSCIYQDSWNRMSCKFSALGALLLWINGSFKLITGRLYGPGKVEETTPRDGRFAKSQAVRVLGENLLGKAFKKSEIMMFFSTLEASTAIQVYCNIIYTVSTFPFAFISFRRQRSYLSYLVLGVFRLGVLSTIRVLWSTYRILIRNSFLCSRVHGGLSARNFSSNLRAQPSFLDCR